MLCWLATRIPHNLVVLSIFMYACYANYPSSAPYGVKMDEDVYTAHSLISHVIETHTVPSALACYVKCTTNCRCVSFNVCENGKKCELNSERKDDQPTDYKTNEQCTYYELSWSAQNSGNNKATPTCSSGCCLTSKPCLNDGVCQPVDHVIGQRYQCTCPDGFKGKRCEIKPRSCADYAQPTDRLNGTRVIFTPENTKLNVICHFRESTTMTLAMSYTRSSYWTMHNQSLAKDFPLSEEVPNFSLYRLSLAHMQGLRDVSSHWAITCAYDTRGFSTTDYILSKVNETDITTYVWADDPSVHCRRYEYVNIYDNTCENCTISTGQNVFMFFLESLRFEKCGGTFALPQVGKCSPTIGTKYFGFYNCYDVKFSCTKSQSSTTQLWFIL